MIDLKNRTRETRTYQFPRTVSAGPVRPQSQVVFRTEHNGKTGKLVQREQTITVGGVLTLGPKQELRNLPDQLLDHPGLQRDIKARAVSLTQRPNTTTAVSVANVENLAAKAETTPAKARNRSRK